MVEFSESILVTIEQVEEEKWPRLEFWDVQAVLLEFHYSRVDALQIDVFWKIGY